MFFKAYSQHIINLFEYELSNISLFKTLNVVILSNRDLANTLLKQTCAAQEAQESECQVPTL